MQYCGTAVWCVIVMKIPNRWQRRAQVFYLSFSKRVTTYCEVRCVIVMRIPNRWQGRAQVSYLSSSKRVAIYCKYIKCRPINYFVYYLRSRQGRNYCIPHVNNNMLKIRNDR